MLVYTYRRGGGHVDLQGEEDPGHPADADQTEDRDQTQDLDQTQELSEIDEQSEPAQSPERGVLPHNRRSVRVDEDVTFNFRV